MENDQIIVYERIKVNGIHLNVAFAGSKKGDPVILLHGFPDASFGWSYQMKALADKGFYVIAPDQRGYNLSDKPRGKESYRMNLLVDDIIGLADRLNLQQFNLAGHDFGAIVCWYLMEHHSARIKRLVILNVPHPKVLMRYQKEDKEQRRKSWYAYFFRIPRLPEFLIRVTKFKMLAKAMRDSFSKEKVNAYKIAWARPGALTAMINWYRSLFELAPEERPKTKVPVPTLIVWGKLDPHIKWEMAEDSAAMCNQGKVVYLEDATHWVLEDAPELTSTYLIDFFTEKMNDR